MASMIGADKEPVNALITTCAEVAEQLPLSAVIVYVPAGAVNVFVEKDIPAVGEQV